MNDIYLSIIIPVYNCEKYIKRCIHSIIEQDIDFMEIIIINDGSTDNTRTICEEFVQKYNNIKSINQENKGVSHSRNIGIQNASGKYVMFIDADDYLVGHSLNNTKELLTGDVDVLRYSYILNDEKMIFTEKIFDLSRNRQKFLNEFFSKTNQNMSWGQVIKRELLNDIKFTKNIFYGEDLLFNSKLYNKCKNIKYTETVLYNYRQNHDSVSRDYKNSKVKSKVENLIYVFNEIMSQYEDKDLIRIIENKFLGEIIPQIMMLTFDKEVNKQEVLKQFEEILNNNIFKNIFKNIDGNQLTMCRYKGAYKFMKYRQTKKLYTYAKIYKQLKMIQRIFK